MGGVDLSWYENTSKILERGRRLLGRRRIKLSPNYSAELFQLLRAGACRQNALSTIECPMWTQSKEQAQANVGIVLSWAPYANSSSYKCSGCKESVVSESQIVEWMSHDVPEIDNPRRFNRILMGDEKIWLDCFRRALGFGESKAWINPFHANILLTFVSKHLYPLSDEFDDLRGVIAKILREWEAAEPDRLRVSIPPSQSSQILQIIRESACLHSSPGPIECLKWTRQDSESGDRDSEGDKVGPRVVTYDYVCDKCRHPVVTVESMLEELCVRELNEKFDERTWRRYVNAEHSVPVDIYRCLLANAYGHGWIDFADVVTEFERVDNLVAVQRSLIALIKKARSREKANSSLPDDFDEVELRIEIDKQLKILEGESIRRLQKRLDDESEPSEVRELIGKWMIELRKS